MPKNDNYNEQKLLDKIRGLEDEIKKLKSRKKYGLVWEDKPEQVVLDCQTKIPVLKEVKDKAINTDKNKPVNILIEGDNYHSLCVLNYTHKGKIDVIYIDPPYNTGAKDWKYNNNFVDGEDSYRHTKWISFMEHRLNIAKNLLTDDGVICAMIDDYEMPRLWLLMENIFGESNHLGTIIIRNNPKGRKTQRKASLIHEYAIFFGKSNKSKIHKLPVSPEAKTHNYKKDEDGNWYLPANLRKQGVDSLAVNKKGELSNRYYPIYCDPKTGKISSKEKLKIKILPIDANGQKRIWRRGKEVIDSMYKDGLLWHNSTKYGDQIYFKFTGGLDGEPPQSIWLDSKFSASEHGTQTVDNILNKREVFPYPKSPYATAQCIKVASVNKKAIILDYFAGSGTTGHSVQVLNKEDKGHRQFILCTDNENNICEDICYPRIKKVIKGYKNLKSKDVAGTGGNLKYFKAAFVDVEKVSNISDDNKIKLTYQAGEMIGLRENTLDEVEKNNWWQIFTDGKKYTVIYFREDKSQLRKLVGKLEKLNSKTMLYIFSWGKNEYKNEFSEYKNIRVEDIPEPIVEVYKEINKL